MLVVRVLAGIVLALRATLIYGEAGHAGAQRWIETLDLRLADWFAPAGEQRFARVR